jgi:hypothetical protein
MIFFSSTQHGQAKEKLATWSLQQDFGVCIDSMSFVAVTKPPKSRALIIPGWGNILIDLFSAFHALKPKIAEIRKSFELGEASNFTFFFCERKV